MSGYVPRFCDKCGAPLEKGNFKRIRADRRTTASYPQTRWLAEAFIRYYCNECEGKVRRAIIMCEEEG